MLQSKHDGQTVFVGQCLDFSNIFSEAHNAHLLRWAYLIIHIDNCQYINVLIIKISLPTIPKDSR